MSAHTPGPWRIERHRSIDIHDAPLEIVDTLGGRIALLVDDDPGSVADAMLIAAAPELLAAAKRALIIMMLTKGLPDNGGCETCKRLRAAITHAEGGG